MSLSPSIPCQQRKPNIIHYYNPVFIDKQNPSFHSTAQSDYQEITMTILQLSFRKQQKQNNPI